MMANGGGSKSATRSKCVWLSVVVCGCSCNCGSICKPGELIIYSLFFVELRSSTVNGNTGDRLPKIPSQIR